jgi:hypothetical protein
MAPGGIQRASASICIGTLKGQFRLGREQRELQNIASSCFPECVNYPRNNRQHSMCAK